MLSVSPAEWVIPPSKKRADLGMTLNCNWWYGSNSGDRGSVEYFFVAITPRSTLTQVVIPVKVPSMCQIDLFKIICIRNTWYCITVLKLVVLRIVIWNYIC